MKRRRTKSKQKTSKDFRGVTRYFIKSTRAISDSAPIVSTVLWTKGKRDFEEVQELIKKKKIKIISREGETLIKIVDLANIKRIERALDESDSSSIAVKTIPRSLFVALVSQFDFFLLELVGLIYEKKPELIKFSDKQIKGSQLLGFSNIKDAFQFIIESEVQKFSQDPHLKNFQWLEKQLKAQITEHLTLPKFLELVQRRHLFVHNNGKVTEKYLRICKGNGIDIKGVKIGDQLGLQNNYFWSAYNCLVETAIKVSMLVWKAVEPKNAEEVDLFLADNVYRDLLRGRYVLAHALSEFAISLSPKSRETELVLEINKILAIKFLNERKTKKERVDIKKLVDEIDWSGVSNRFILAREVLLEDYKKAVKVMELMGDRELQDEYKIWPLFKKFRETATFKKAYKKIFKVAFTVEKPKIFRYKFDYKKPAFPT